MYVCYLKCYLVFINVITLFYYQGALAMSAKLRNVNRKIVHSAIERKGFRFHRVLKHTDVSVCVCMYVSAIFYISSQHIAIPFPSYFTFRKSGLSGSSLSRLNVRICWAVC